MKKLFLIILLSSFSLISTAQLEFAPGFGGQIGLSFNFGTHYNRIGLMAKLYYHYEYVQANFQVCGFYNARSFPVGKPSWEGQMRVGVVACFGKRDSIHFDPFITEISNQASRPYSIGYAYNFYLDNMQTSQLSGTFGFGIHNFKLHLENDFMAFFQEDKHRTGAMALYYRLGNIQLGLCHIAWTADPYAENTITMKSRKFPAKYGYRAMEDSQYSNHSAGVFALQVEAALPFGQYLGAQVGVDAEQLRNLFQNKLIHDSIFLTDPHVPMIDSEGKQYLYGPNQKIRAPKPYFQVMLNNGALY